MAWRAAGHVKLQDVQDLGFRVLGGSWGDISRVISTLHGVVSIVTTIPTLLRTTHEALSRVEDSGPPDPCSLVGMLGLSAGATALLFAGFWG